MGDAKITERYDFDAWRINPELGSQTFAFVPPPGAQKTDPPGSGGSEEEEEGSALLGKPAPPTKLTLMSGESLDLESLKGQVVMLDFWASWCGPCRVSLPVVTKVAGDYADRGVQFYAVNLGEDAETVQLILSDPEHARVPEGVVEERARSATPAFPHWRWACRPSSSAPGDPESP